MTMASVYRRVEPAQVLQVAGVSPDDVPLYLAQMEDRELGTVAGLAQGLLAAVNEVVAHRRFAVLWERVGGQIATDYARPGMDAVWGPEPRWPGDEPGPAPVAPEVDPDSTQIIPADQIATTGVFGPCVEPTAVDAPDPSGRPEPAVLDHTIPDAVVPPNAVDQPTVGPGVSVTVASTKGPAGPATVAWYPPPPADEDWTAAPVEDPAPPTLVDPEDDRS